MLISTSEGDLHFLFSAGGKCCLALFLGLIGLMGLFTWREIQNPCRARGVPAGGMPWKGMQDIGKPSF